MIENYPIDFKATAKFYFDYLKGSEIIDVLRESKFDGKILNVTSDAVYAEVEGTFKGRWVTSSGIHTVPN
jgi:hypothetical protein